MPTVLNAIGWTFPLRHAVAAAVTATSGGALDGTFWGHLAVLVLWTGIGLLVAWRFFHWEPRQARVLALNPAPGRAAARSAATTMATWPSPIGTASRGSCAAACSRWPA